VANANRPASASTPSLAPSVHCDTKQTIDGGDSIIDANPPPPSLVSYENALQLLAAHHAKKRHMESKKKKIPNSSNKLVHSKKEATELICPRYLLTER
jgi:hypothetical protein